MPISSAPVCTVLGGANGSGKSSLYELLEPPGEFVNADIVARQLNPVHPEAVSFTAGKSVLRRLDELIRDRRDFVYETTLSGNQPLELMKAAKQRGYRVGLAFIVLADVELNISRVAQRVAEGGHDIPEAVIRRRFNSSLARLAGALRLADDAAVFDNTARQAQILIRMQAGSVTEDHLNGLAPTHRLLAKVVADAVRP